MDALAFGYEFQKIALVEFGKSVKINHRVHRDHRVRGIILNILPYPVYPVIFL